MKLTAPARRGTGARLKPTAETTTPGFVNPNAQSVVRDTGAASKLRDRQSVYELRCTRCGFRYGCNGMEIRQRRCPSCDGGVAGEPLQARSQASLFAEAE